MNVKDKNGNSIPDNQKNIEFFKTSYSKKLKDISQLQNTLKTEKKRLAILQKLAEYHEASIIGGDINEGVHKTRETPVEIDQVDALCQLLQKDINITEEFTDCKIIECNVKILNASKDEIIKQYTTLGRVGEIDFNMQIISKFEVLTGLEREVEMKTLTFIPMASEFAALQDYLMANQRSCILQRALRTFQSMSSEMQELRNELSGIPDIGMVVKRYSLALTYTPSILRDPPEGSSKRSSKQSATLRFQWKIIFRETVENFKYWFDLNVPDDVAAVFSTSPIASYLKKEKSILTAEDVRILFITITK